MNYDIDTAKKLVIKAGLELIEKGLIARTWGNISARVSDSEFVITPSGRDYASLTPDDIVLVNLDGSYYGDVKPSSEKGVHAVAYMLRKDVNFVIHTHQKHASALSILGKNISLDTVADDNDKEILGHNLVCARYGMNATEKLNNAVYDALYENPKCSQVLMKYHGALCVGKDYDDAFLIADTLEKVSKAVYENIVGESVKEKDDERLIIQEAETEITPFSIIHAKTPYIMEMSKLGKKMRAYSDDLAQIAGPVIYCSESDELSEINKKKKSASAVFIKWDGAFCYGINNDEAEAVAIVLEKACQAAYLGFKEKIKPLGLSEAKKDRKIYLTKYSLLKDN